MELPLILAGPILRRVEPNLVSVWLALSKKASVKLKLFRGQATSDSVDNILITGPAEQTIRIGDNLHIAVVTIKIPIGTGQTLLPGQIYSYDLLLQTGQVSKNLTSCDLLKSEDINGHPHLALGYEPGVLPSFALPPVELTDLHLVHGSCRRANFVFSDGRPMPDGLAWVDDLISDARQDFSSFALKRPHQLLLSGDQIYADDLTIPQLQIISDFGLKLFGGFLDPLDEELLPLEQLPIDGKLYRADLNNFPPGHRSDPDRDSDPKRRSDPDRDLDPEYHSDLVQGEARMTSTDGTSHLFSFAEFCAMYLFSWSSVCWPSEWPTEDSFLPPLPWEGLIASDLLSKIRPPIKADDRDAIKGIKNEYKRGIIALKNVLKTMPNVRRALANVPTYMILDDHEVTDDLYLNPTWRDRVLTSPLGKTILRNGMLSYALFQGWGNDPVKFESGAYKQLIDSATQLFPENATVLNEAAGDQIDRLFGFDLNGGLEATRPPITWHYSVPGTKHMVLVLDDRTCRSYVTRDGPIGNVAISAMDDQIPVGPLPAGIEVLVVVVSLQVIGPPVLDELIAPLSYKALDLIKHNKLQKYSGSKNMTGTHPDAIESWAYDVKTFEALLKRLEPYRRVIFLSGDVHYGAANAMSYWKKGDTEPARFAQFTSSGMQNVMASPWAIMFADRSLAFAQRMIRADIGADRLVWDNNKPAPLVIPTGAKMNPPVQLKLKQSPMMISVEDCPRGTTIDPARPPDCSWKVEPSRDLRPDADRPELAQPESVGDTDVSTNLDGYRRVVKRHVAQLGKFNNSRQMLFSNNIGVITFQKRTEKIDATPNADPVEVIEAVQSLYTTHPKAEDPDKAEAYTVCVIPLCKPNEARPESKLTGL
jgi:hypothetical protein